VTLNRIVAVLTNIRPCVVITGRAPVLGRVAVLTRTGIVIVILMARSTSIALARSDTPICMAGMTIILPFWVMARNTVPVIGVSAIIPSLCLMTIRALSIIMLERGITLVAGQTIIIIPMLISRCIPIGHIFMAFVTPYAVIVRSRHFGVMTRRTVCGRRSLVIVFRYRPVHDILVANDAIAPIVGTFHRDAIRLSKFRQMHLVAIPTTDIVLVVERVGRPRIGAVAIRTLTGIMLLRIAIDDVQTDKHFAAQ